MVRYPVDVLLAGCAFSSPQITYYSLYARHRRRRRQLPRPVAPGGKRWPGSYSRHPQADADRTAAPTAATSSASTIAGAGTRPDFARAVAEQLARGLGTNRWRCSRGTSTSRRPAGPYRRAEHGGAPGQEATLAVRWSLVDPQGQKPAQIRRSELREVPAAAGYPAWIAANNAHRETGAGDRRGHQGNDQA